MNNIGHSFLVQKVSFQYNVICSASGGLCHVKRPPDLENILTYSKKTNAKLIAFVPNEKWLFSFHDL